MASEPTGLNVSKHKISSNGPKDLSIPSMTAEELIQYRQSNPAIPVIEGLLNDGEILLLHGSEESFKSVFVLQMAESVALRRPLFNHWPMKKTYRAGVIETEINQAQLGDRLVRMFPNGDSPKNLFFLTEEALRQWRPLNMDQKFRFVQKWIDQHGIEVLMVDIASDFFRGGDNPSGETSVGRFFDQLRGFNVKASIIVRHDRKRRSDRTSSEGGANDNIRGSAEWKEDPEAILSIRRADRRTNQVQLEVGKLRYGQKPDKPLSLWFDAGTFRLTPLLPIVAVMRDGDSRSRKEIVAACRDRFGLGERKVDQMLAEQREYLIEHQEGHEKTFQLDIEKAIHAPWARFLFGKGVSPIREG